MTFDWLVGLFLALTIIPAIVLHESMHALVADRLGDPTARQAGRVSLNPLRHIDPFGTVILPGLLIVLAVTGNGGPVFGYAKPVPVVGSRLRNPRVGMLLVSLAGPGMNLLLAAIAALILRAVEPGWPERIVQFLFFWVLTNLVLTVFNMLPVPPLDGSEVVAFVLPKRLRRGFMNLRRYSFVLLLALLLLFPGAWGRVVEPLVFTLFEALVGL